MTTTPLTALDTALSYTAAGWPVFPCRAAEENDPRTGEILNPKTPYPTNGFKAATRYERIIRRWWADNPDAAIGIPTGAPIGAFVLDVDRKPGGADGFEWLAEMEAQHGQLPETRRVTTPNNGLHYYFKHVDGVRNRGALGAGCDIRGSGGYVLAAGSVMADGRAYTLQHDAPIADAPDWLLDLLLKPAPAPKSEYRPTQVSNQPYVQRAVDDELADLAAAPAGNRNNALNDAAFAVGQFVGAGAISRGEAEHALQEIARPWGNFAKSCGTIRNGLDAGIKSPRDIPEPAADNTRLVDITRMIANGLAKAGKAADGKLPVREENAQQAANDTDREGIRSEDAIPERIGTDGTISEPGDDDRPAIFATPFKWIDPKTLPRREFLFGTHYIRKYVAVTVAPGGLGKTANSIAEALAMTSGKSLTGDKPPTPLACWLFNAEDPRDELDRRIMAAALHYKLSPADFEGRLFLDSGREQELVIARDDKKTGVKIVEPIVEAVVAQIMRHQIDVMIVDPFVSTHRVNENDNGAIDAVAKLWAQIADYTGCAIDIVHHLRKVADREATVEDARGAVSLIGAARSVRVLNRMTPDQETAAGLPAGARMGMFSITYGKSNLTPLNNSANWRRLESVPLGNGRGLMKPQDFAPVVTEWHWPDAAEQAGAMTAEQRARLLGLIGGGDYKEGIKAKLWIGDAIIDVMGWDADVDGVKKRAAGMVKALLADGTLVKAQDRDLISRKTEWFIRAG